MHPCPGKVSVPYSQGYGSHHARRIPTGKYALHAGFLHRIGFDDCAEWALVHFQSKLFCHWASQFKGRKGKDARKTERTPFVKTDVGITRDRCYCGALHSHSASLKGNELLCNRLESPVEQKSCGPQSGSIKA